MNSLVTPQAIGRFLNVLQQTFVIATQEYNFKNGAFKGQITSSTNVVDAVELLLASPLLSADEKAAMNGVRASIIRVLTRGNTMTSFDLMVEMSVNQHITDIFDADRIKQGQYVPPMMIQSFGKDGKVGKTFKITDDGVKMSEGGEVGVVPGAPDEFNQKQRDYVNSLGLGKGKKAKTTQAGRKAMDMDVCADSMGTKSSGDEDTVEGDAAGEAEKVNGPKANLAAGQSVFKDDFGSAFKRNLRGAFS